MNFCSGGSSLVSESESFKKSFVSILGKHNQETDLMILTLLRSLGQRTDRGKIIPSKKIEFACKNPSNCSKSRLSDSKSQQRKEMLFLPVDLMEFIESISMI